MAVVWHTHDCLVRPLVHQTCSILHYLCPSTSTRKSLSLLLAKSNNVSNSMTYLNALHTISAYCRTSITHKAYMDSKKSKIKKEMSQNL